MVGDLKGAVSEKINCESLRPPGYELIHRTALTCTNKLKDIYEHLRFF